MDLKAFSYAIAKELDRKVEWADTDSIPNFDTEFSAGRFPSEQYVCNIVTGGEPTPDEARIVADEMAARIGRDAVGSVWQEPAAGLRSAVGISGMTGVRATELVDFEDGRPGIRIDCTVCHLSGRGEEEKT